MEAGNTMRSLMLFCVGNVLFIYVFSTQSESESRDCYITVTSVPSVSCADCHRIAQSFGDEDLAASWDSCVRFSCLRHGYTIHSTYSIVPPYPSFIATVSLRCDGTIVINTANFLHVLTFQVEFPISGNANEQDYLFGSSAGLDDLQQSGNSQDWDEESERSGPYSNARSASVTPITSPASVPAINHKKCTESPGPLYRNGQQPAESEYDFMEDASETPRETISAFRKRRLADKTYEFKDENTENVPLRAFRKRRAQEQQRQQQQPSVVIPESKDSSEDWEWNFSCTGGSSTDVLRPFNSNVPTPIRSPEWDMVEEVRTTRPVSLLTKVPQSPTCVAKFHRRYFEVDDELVSVITDIEGQYEG